MDKMMKVLMLGLVIMWVVLPDPIPGPIDDIIIIVIAYAASKRKLRIR